MGVVVRQKVRGRGNPWWVFINHQGKRKSVKVGDKTKAQEVAAKIEKALAEKKLNIHESNKTFGNYAREWLEKVVPVTLKSSTREDYRAILKNHILPDFESKPITHITRIMVKDFLSDKLQKGLAASTVTHIKNVLSGVFNRAVDDQVIGNNPAQRLGKLIKPKSRRLEVQPLTRQELSLLLDTAAKKFPRHYPLILLLARTGLRLGEALALQWADIDFNGRFIEVRRNLSRSRIETPKNGKSRRVDMSRQLTQTLKELIHQRKMEAVKKGWGQVPEWIFITESGSLVDPNNWRHRVFNKVLAKAGLRRIRIHDLRHGMASQLIQNGESLAYVRDQLGHHSIKVTVDIYGHLAPEGNKDAVDRLDDDHNLGAYRVRNEGI